MIVVELPYPPSVNHLYANVRGKGRTKTDRYRTWIVSAGWALKAAKPEPVMGDVTLSMNLCKPDARKRDLSNLLKATEDLLVAHGLIEDDSKIVALSVQWVPQGPPCVVTVRAAA